MLDLDHDLANFFIKGQIINILGFLGLKYSLYFNLLTATVAPKQLQSTHK